MRKHYLSSNLSSGVNLKEKFHSCRILTRIVNILIGVNLLREGLDLPEVTLVAILDADREGFLRNETSLIQTMGRTARNVKGKVILYADTITKSIRNAKSEVERRRKKQMEYNKKHKITPKTISKVIESLLGLEND